MIIYHYPNCHDYNIYSYLEIRSAFQKFNFIRLGNMDLDLILGGYKNYQTIDNISSRIIFHANSFILLQHHQRGKKTIVVNRWDAIEQGADKDFIFIPKKDCFLSKMLKKERKLNLINYSNVYKDKPIKFKFNPRSKSK